MNRSIKWLAVAAVGIGTIGYGSSLLWPVYDWDLRLRSPDGRFDLVVLRGDTAAFDDFYWKIDLFPHDSTPGDRPKGTQVWLKPDDKYLVYGGYNYPSFRWTGLLSVEIDLREARYSPFTLNSVKRFESSTDDVLISVAFGKDDASNTLP